MRYVSHLIHKVYNLITFWQWHVPVCALFKGRLVDKPESPMLATAQTSGGEAEHEVSMAEGTLLYLTELNLYFRSERDNLAQVLLQLACKYFFYMSMGGYYQTA